jgi:Holliday junction resolvase
MIKTKIKGIRLEREIQKKYQKMGYHCWRLAGSLGLFDLVAVNQTKVKFIQIKSNYIPPKTLEEIKKFPVPQGVEKIIWLYKKGEWEKLIFNT